MQDDTARVIAAIKSEDVRGDVESQVDSIRVQGCVATVVLRPGASLCFGLDVEYRTDAINAALKSAASEVSGGQVHAIVVEPAPDPTDTYERLERSCRDLASRLESALRHGGDVAGMYAQLVESDATLRQLWKEQATRTSRLWRCGWTSTIRRATEYLAARRAARPHPCGPITRHGHDPFASHAHGPVFAFGKRVVDPLYESTGGDE